jgi:hypothetical protein
VEKGSPYTWKRKDRKNEDGETEKRPVWTLKSDAENLLYSRILDYLIPHLLRAEETLSLPKEERKAILLFLEEYGKDHYTLVRTRDSLASQHPELRKFLAKASEPPPPQRKRVRIPKRRRSSEDRSGKPGSSKLGNKRGYTFPGSSRNIPIYNSSGEQVGTQAGVRKPRDPELLVREFLRISPRDNLLRRWVAEKNINQPTGENLTPQTVVGQSQTKGKIICPTKVGQPSQQAKRTVARAFKMVNRVRPGSLPPNFPKD